MAQRNWVTDMWATHFRKEGVAEGERRGERRGKAVGAEETLAILLATRFGPLSKTSRTRLASLCGATRALTRLTRAALAAETLTDFFVRAAPPARASRPTRSRPV